MRRLVDPLIHQVSLDYINGFEHGLDEIAEEVLMVDVEEGFGIFPVFSGSQIIML